MPIKNKHNIKQPEKTNPNKDIIKEKKLKAYIKARKINNFLIQKIKESKKVTNFKKLKKKRVQALPSL